MAPKKIRIVEKEFLELVWDNEEVYRVKISKLRDECPCAYCAEEREKQSDFYIPLYTLDQVTITGIEPMGHYGIKVKWQDEHSTGIFQYETLKQLAVK